MNRKGTMFVLTVLVLVLPLIVSGQSVIPLQTTVPPPKNHYGVKLSQRIGNFSLELLYKTAKGQPENANLILSPITIWTVMALIAEGATGDTYSQLKYALRLFPNSSVTRSELRDIAQWLQVNTSTVELVKFNGIFVDSNRLPLRDFSDVARNFYDTRMVKLDFKDTEKAASWINQAISQFTRGRVPTLVDSNYFQSTQMILTSALYFKGQWTAPFNASSTTKMPFFDSNRTRIGEVNMMYNRFTYPFANIRDLQARVLELPYGKENRLSMLVMLPDPGLSLADMFQNFLKKPLDVVFEELKIAQEEYGEEEVDVFIPRFKINSDLDMTEILKNGFAIHDLFDSAKSQLPNVARTPLFVSKVIHKAEIEVTEEGTVASGVTAAEFANRISIARFEANRPFSYLIVEKLTNSIVFGGIYRQPALY